MKKMTKKDYFATLLTISEVNANPALVEFINHEVELLERKNSGEKKPTAVQMENMALKSHILELLTSSPVTVTELQKKSEQLGELSNQRVSALLRQMVESGEVVRSVDKRKTYFSKG